MHDRSGESNEHPAAEKSCVACSKLLILKLEAACTGMFGQEVAHVASAGVTGEERFIAAGVWPVSQGQFEVTE